jgi:hypothetical protein
MYSYAMLSTLIETARAIPISPELILHLDCKTSVGE